MKKLLILLVLVLAAGAVWYFRQGPAELEGGKKYVGRSAEECSRIQVMCIPGYERFDDQDGCGCKPVSVQIPSSWKSYDNPRYGFAMRYDPTLTVEEDQGTGVRFWKWGPTQRGQTELYDGIMLSIRPVPAPDGVDRYIAAQTAQIKENGTITEELHDGVLNGMPTKEFGFTGLGDYRFIFLPVDAGSLLEITSITPDPTAAGFRASVEAMLSTLELR
jgi:hypothetical protein